MTSRDSQIPRTCHICCEIHTPSLCYIPLKCWNCGKEHLHSQEFCHFCNGWVLPTLTHGTIEEPAIHIGWKIFLIASTSSLQDKSEQLRLAATAIQDDQYTAVLCAESLDGTYGKNKERTAAFLHRPGGDKRLSFTKLYLDKIMASSRKWMEIRPADWVTFDKMVGVTSLPSNFPKPDFPNSICPQEGEELDTDARCFKVSGLRG